MFGKSKTGDGVYAQSLGGGYGLYATSSTGDGVHSWISDSNSAVFGENDASSGNAIYGRATGAGAFAGHFDGSVTVDYGFSYMYNGSCVAGYCTSDERLKQNIEPLTDALGKLTQLKGVTYEWKQPDDHGHPAGTQTGFIAQDVEKAFPGWVEQNQDGFKGIVVPPMQLAALEVESIRALKVRADKAEAESKSFKERLDAVENGRVLPKAGGLLSSPAGGWAFGGLALAASLVITRRRRQDDRS